MCINKKSMLLCLILAFTACFHQIIAQESPIQSHEKEVETHPLFLKIYPLQYLANEQILLGISYHYTNRKAIEIQAGPLFKDYYYTNLLHTYSYLPATGASLHFNHRIKLKSKKKRKSYCYLNHQVFAKYVKFNDFRYDSDSDAYDSINQTKFVLGYKFYLGFSFPIFKFLYLDINAGIGIRNRRTKTNRFYKYIYSGSFDEAYEDKTNKIIIANQIIPSPHFQLGLAFKIK